MFAIFAAAGLWLLHLDEPSPLHPGRLGLLSTVKLGGNRGERSMALMELAWGARRCSSIR